jgi:methylated-DNA-[protein]-cysteine S-methyltransferase
VKVKDLITESYNSPFGEITVISTIGGIISLNFSKSANSNTHKTEIQNQLDEYFSGTRRNFNLKLNLQGTAFQKKAWQAMLQIPYGKTTTYGEIANKIGHPKAARAVGMACNKNPVIIIVPCHRILGASGKLTGYSAGLDKKQWLIEHENCI